MTIPIRPEERFAPAADGDRTELFASTCTGCTRTHFPTVAECPACGGEVQATRLARGRLSALTTVTAPPPGALVEPPYSVGIADFAEGIRVIGLVAGTAETGDDIEVVAHEYHQDRVTFAFRRSHP